MSAGRLYLGFLQLLAIIAGLLIVFLTVVIGSEAIFRSLHIGTIRGSVEFAEYAMFNLALLAAPWLLYHDAHLRVTVLLDNVPDRAKGWIRLVADLIGLVAAAVTLRYGIEVFITSYKRQQMIFNDVVIMEWWLQWQVPFVMALLVIEFLRRIVTARPMSPRKEETHA